MTYRTTTSPAAHATPHDRRRPVQADDSMTGFTFAALASLATIVALVALALRL
jgi:hypothetical protein